MGQFAHRAMQPTLLQQDQFVIFADLILARRLERAAMAIESGYARSHAGLGRNVEIEILPVDGE